MPQWNDGAGISSSIPDVMTTSWANLSRDHKLLICQAGQIGELHKGGLQLENSRRELAIGMAAIEIYQTLIDRQYEVWTNPRYYPNGLCNPTLWFGTQQTLGGPNPTKNFNFESEIRINQSR